MMIVRKEGEGEGEEGWVGKGDNLEERERMVKEEGTRRIEVKKRKRKGKIMGMEGEEKAA